MRSEYCFAGRRGREDAPSSYCASSLGFLNLQGAPHRIAGGRGGRRVQGTGAITALQTLRPGPA